jgi:hypothetical protein
MRTKTWRAAACLIACAVSTSSFGAIKNNFVAPEARTVEGGREVLIVVEQAEIKPNINISNITAATGGGLLFALIDAGVNNARAKEAEKTVVPLRESMVGFDFDPLAQELTSATLASLGWFDVKQLKLTKDGSASTVTAALDGSTAPQIMVLRYAYETNAEFSAIVVSLEATLVNKAVPKGKKPAARTQIKYLPYRQPIRSMIMLPGASEKDADANVKAWSADGGRMARAAVEAGLQRCQLLLKKSLALSATEAAYMTKRNKRPVSRIPNTAGWELESQEGSTLVFDVLTLSMLQAETYKASAAAPAVVEPAPAAVPPPAPATPEAPALAPVQ